MALILNIETATKNCSVSLADKGKTVSCQEIAEENFSHAEKLHVFIDDILNKNQCSYKDLKAIAVSQGPGSYTGLRIGVSAAKGLSYALNIPLIAVETLTILAHKLNISDGFIVPMIDARRMEVYSAIFNSNFSLFREVKAEVIDKYSFSKINNNLHLIGDGTQKLKEVLTDEKFIFYQNIVYPSANEMATISYEKFLNKNFVDVAYFEPYYLKDFMGLKTTL